LARALVPAFANDLVYMSNDAADAWIGLRRIKPSLGQPQRVRHVAMIDGAERRHAFLA
jgi:hypothetical protein